MSSPIRSALAFVLALGVASSAWAQRPQVAGPEFPRQAAAWINSPPLSKDLFKGKAVVLWYFEEGCPSCRAKWPELLGIAKKYEGKPVAFIAVNSGNSRAEVEAYVKDVGIPWPVIVDTDRSLEKVSGVGEISLQNIYQAKLLTADGSLVPAFDLDKGAEQGLRDAKWKVDPTDIPAALKPAWSGVEFGNYPAAAAVLKKNATSAKPDIKAAVEKLQTVIKADLDSALASAKEAEGTDKWKAYKLYLEISETFKGLDVPTEVAATLKTLAVDDKVKGELKARKTLDGIQKAMPSASTPAARKRIIGQLERLAKDEGETEAGGEAKLILEQVNAAPVVQ